MRGTAGNRRSYRDQYFGAFGPKRNTFVHPPLSSSSDRLIIRPSPDLAYSCAVFDVREHPIRVVVPITRPYTSLAGYGTNTDNFFCLNDLTAKEDVIDVVVVGPSTPHIDLKGAQVVESPSHQGVLLVRRVVSEANADPEIDQVRQKSRIEELK